MLLACPAGDIPFHVVAMDAADNPVANSTIVIGFPDCPAVRIATPVPSDPYGIQPGFPYPNVLRATGLDGRATFPLRAGGSCLGSVRVWADGITTRNDGTPIGPPNAVSPDQNGDLVVDVRDLSRILGKCFAPAYDASGDLNGDGRVNPSDLAIVLRHLGHRG